MKVKRIVKKKIIQKKKKKEITSKEEKNKQTNINNESKKESTTTKASDKPSSNEKKENKNENRRRGDSIKIELIGDEQITIEKGSKYSDPGFKAVYSDGSDASSEVEIENSVNSSEEGSYTVTYFAGNNVVIRRVFVK